MPRFCKHLSVCKCWTINSRYIKIHCPSPPTPSSRIIDIWQGSEYLIDSKNVTVLNICGFSKYQNSKYIRALSMPGFWIYQGSEEASGSQYTRFLNIPEFWICQGFTGTWICLNNSWICLVMPEYAGVWVDIPKSAWMAFDLYVPIITFYIHKWCIVV